MIFADAETGYLVSQRLGRLAAIQPDGSPRSSRSASATTPSWARSTWLVSTWPRARSSATSAAAAGPRLWSMTSPRPAR